MLFRHAVVEAPSKPVMTLVMTLVMPTVPVDVIANF
jgi:hypothetical protein